MKYEADHRIGIVGAGPAGLTAAVTLRSLGYTNITLLEKEDHAGGKCHSITLKDHSYEIGAGIVSDSNHTIRDLATKFNVRMAPLDFVSRIDLDIDTGTTVRFSPIRKIQLLYQVLFRYRPLTKKYQSLTTPGFLDVPKELCVPFSTWAKVHHIEILAKELADYFTGFGYGFYEEVSAAYVLKYYPWDIIMAFFKQSFFKFPDGIQRLWTTIAEKHEVLYGRTIQRITRDTAVTVTTDKESFTFDALILTSPLDETPRFMDVSSTEIGLFSKILTYDYRTYACTLKDFPKKTGYIPGNLTISRLGHPVFWYLRFKDSDLYTFYLLGNEKVSDEEAILNIKDVVEMLGGKITDVKISAHWKYFPHVTPEEMANGYYNKLEALQGTQHTYYAGELLNFSTVDHSASYAKNLVERFF
ncbi:MAG: FAD-dependent oxidoreductase [Candidatus Uhrbacteria bacterium]